MRWRLAQVAGKKLYDEAMANNNGQKAGGDTQGSERTRLSGFHNGCTATIPRTFGIAANSNLGGGHLRRANRIDGSEPSDFELENQEDFSVIADTSDGKRDGIFAREPDAASHDRTVEKVQARFCTEAGARL